jgi:cyclopropane-fatty-acyl-phospholipid synthase
VCSDEFSLRYSDLVTGSYDCVDRIVLNAFFPLGYNPGGFRVWWRRWHDDSDAELDNTHLMRMTLLDVGCGWGSTMMRAIERFDVNVVGLTLSENQKTHVEKVFAESGSDRTKCVLLQGWEQFDQPVDRIVSIGAFEHFGHERYPAFFKMAKGALPDDGIMLLHTITGLHPTEMAERGMPLTFQFARFLKFILTEIFPGGRLPSIPMVEQRATEAGLTVTRVQSLQPHYARTLDLWAAALEARKDEAIAIQSEEVYERYMKYLTGCAGMFRIGYIDVNQFTLEK